MQRNEQNTLFLDRNCVRAFFQSREKRFTIRGLMDGNPIAAHTNNSGSMLGLLRPGREILLSPAANPTRKLPYTLEMVYTGQFWVGVNTYTPNRMLRLAWQNSLIPELKGFEHFRSEARIGNSRLDALLHGSGGRMWIEAKNVTLMEEDKAYFPDAVSKRASKHMQELMIMADAGYRTVCLYLVQRPDCHCFGPADFIDQEFADMLRKAVRKGLMVLAYDTVTDPTGITLYRPLPLKF
ncbi:DNA/RNA nuclease SfsA [Desulfonatronospira sp.]|uniref:DNA/RNA nuclease SfsA n=1 Tax=Desulfonatronospira sp. TaxID=1962951 RepID=UPI0025C2CA21|nr:DNA/RNA nuclease SfsA [Desulfonatronospira sp.]